MDSQVGQMCCFFQFIEINLNNCSESGTLTIFDYNLTTTPSFTWDSFITGEKTVLHCVGVQEKVYFRMLLPRF